VHAKFQLSNFKSKQGAGGDGWVDEMLENLQSRNHVKNSSFSTQLLRSLMEHNILKLLILLIFKVCLNFGLPHPIYHKNDI